jgi:tetratricopeptide (TPR) repeat protein
MKNKIITLIVLVLPLLLMAQPGKKPKPKEKPPTQTEMEKMMKEAQIEIDNIDPETLRMMDSMGIKRPSLKNVPKVSNKQLADAWEAESLLVPKKDLVKIAAIPKTITDARIGAYITSIQNKSVAFLKPQVKTIADKIYSYIKLNSKNSFEAGNMVMGLWMAGKCEMAYYTLGKICADDPANTNNLSNYASMLSMLGAQHLAIPILNNLNAKLPKNSTLLNNLGQAWFGLGEIAKAEKYLDSAIRIYAYHPQANLTKAAIEESKGNTAKAKEALLKSIKHSYTKEKEDMLRKLGHEIKIKDLRLPFKPGPDPLGLEKFKRPDYPTSLTELKTLKPIWENFDRECDSRLAQLNTEMKEIAANYEKDLKSNKIRFALPIHIKKASLQLNEIKEYYETVFKTLGDKHIVFTEDIEKIKKEHKRAAPEAPCEAHQEAESDFIRTYNVRKKAYDEEMLKTFRHYFNELAYWSQYTSTDKNQFDLIVLEFKITWLKKIKEYRPLLSSGYEYLECAKDNKAKPEKLSHFDDVACQYNDTMNLKIIKFTNNCSRMTSEFDFMFLGYVRKDDFERAENDTYMSSTYKISAEVGVDKSAGPLKVEAKLAGGVELEFGRGGIEDVLLIGEAKVGAGTNVLDENEETGSTGIGIAGKDAFPTTVEVGAEGRISIITGKGSVTGTGILKDIKMADW